VSTPHAFSPGLPRPPGATPRDGGVDFALYSEHATAVELIFDLTSVLGRNDTGKPLVNQPLLCEPAGPSGDRG
jgi:hypothetical protein